MKTVILLFSVLILTFAAFGQEAKDANKYDFPGKDFELSVTFPDVPEIEAIYGQENSSVMAEVKFSNGFLRVQNLLLSAKEAKIFAKKNDAALAEFPTRYAEASGLMDSTVKTGTDQFGRYAKLRAYKYINGAETTFEIYFYVGKSQIITLYTGAESSIYPTTEVAKFLDSLKLNPNFKTNDDRKKLNSTSDGTLNGKAKSLPKPEYPLAAKAARASGAVKIQVRIDENGGVISAKVISGHPLLQLAAEKAALQAKFNPLYMYGRKIKVTGLIVYNFIP